MGGRKEHPIADKSNPFGNPVWNEIMRRTPSVNEIYCMSMEEFGKMEEPCELMEPQTIPGCLYEYMLSTIIPYNVCGVLWYQGESDDEEGMQILYDQMLCNLIRDWREAFHNEKLPFFIVQLPGFKQWLMIENSYYSIIRECQRIVSETVPFTFLCSISDAGEEYDIHPKNKEIVGKRLALMAENYIYGHKTLCEAPKLNTIEQVKNYIVLSFINAESGLHVDGNQINALELYDENKQIINFTFEIQNEKIFLFPEKQVQSIHFAQRCWYSVNLYNKNNIPAIPFVREL